MRLANPANAREDDGGLEELIVGAREVITGKTVLLGSAGVFLLAHRKHYRASLLRMGVCRDRARMIFAQRRVSCSQHERAIARSQYAQTYEVASKLLSALTGHISTMCWKNEPSHALHSFKGYH